MTQPMSEPTMELMPQGSLASPTKTDSAVNEDMLSPVSKLELSRKYAAEEQQKRVEHACERLVNVKKAQLVEGIEFQQTVSEDGDSKRSGRLSSIAMRVVGAFTSTNDENDATAVNRQMEEPESSSPTRQLLRATRNKLSALVSKAEEGESFPATTYHLKQMGLADDKVNIYASIEEQKNELRRRRESAIRCQEKYMQENAEINHTDEGYKSAEDSDFAPGDDGDEDSSDDLSDWEVDQEELHGLILDQSECVDNIATLKKYKRATKRAATLKRFRPVGLVVLVLVGLLVMALAIAAAEHQSGFCRALVSQIPPVEEARVFTCSAVVCFHDVLASVLSLLPSRQ